ncbi:MAG: anthranilate synthase component I [Elusimicrobiota bacterium]
MKKTITAIKEKIIADFITPVSAYTLLGKGDYSFLLESAEKGRAGRYSFIGFAPRKLYKLHSDKVEVFKRGEKGLFKTSSIKTGDPVGFMQSVQSKYCLKEESSLPPFCGGLVGYAGYEIIETFEDIKLDYPRGELFPLGLFMFTDEIIAFDHLHNTAEIIKLIDDKGSEKKARQRIKEIKNALAGPANVRGMDIAPPESSDFKSSFTKKEFMKGVENIKKDIVNGEIIQAVFSQRFEKTISGDAFDCYRALRVINPSPYMFYLKFKDIFLCGSSPEVMVKTSGRKAFLRPIAGTRHRSSSLEKEKMLEKELKKDPKEIAEHVMLVDLGRNDLGKVCEAGSVKIKEMMAVEKYSHVMHMVSSIEGRLKKGAENADVFKSCFPAGTVSGAPKLRAMEIINREEKLRRGPYAGAVGYFSFTGDMDTCIAIRTMMIKEKKAFIQAGAGIVADSVAENEYYETVNKAKALLRALDMAAKKKGGEND